MLPDRSRIGNCLPDVRVIAEVKDLYNWLAVETAQSTAEIPLCYLCFSAFLLSLEALSVFFSSFFDSLESLPLSDEGAADFLA